MMKSANQHSILALYALLVAISLSISSAFSILGEASRAPLDTPSPLPLSTSPSPLPLGTSPSPLPLSTSTLPLPSLRRTTRCPKYQFFEEMTQSCDSCGLICGANGFPRVDRCLQEPTCQGKWGIEMGLMWDIDMCQGKLGIEMGLM